MSEPTFRITIEHQPQWTMAYCGRAYRVSDGYLVYSFDAVTREEVLHHLQTAIKRAAEALPTETVYATEVGELVY